MVAASLIEALSNQDRERDVEVFTRRFASRLRWWILALPAGVGKATARSGIRLWLGFKPENAGVFSAGNGPAMRAAIFGAAIDDVPRMLNFVRASSRLTHTDPKAEYGAIAVALAAREAKRSRIEGGETVDANRWLVSVEDAMGGEGSELHELLRKAIASVTAGETTIDFAGSLGLEKGVTGYTYHTVPVAIHAWLSHPSNFKRAVTTLIQCGGDADTTAAIVGGIVGAGVGSEGIPSNLLDGICESPRSVRWMRTLGASLAAAEGKTPEPVRRLNPLSILIRNLFFLAVVLFHGFRRLAPPY
jgi:ADP-ribosylglycohydrolase